MIIYPNTITLDDPELIAGANLTATVWTTVAATTLVDANAISATLKVVIHFSTDAGSIRVYIRRKGSTASPTTINQVAYIPDNDLGLDEFSASIGTIIVNLDSNQEFEYYLSQGSILANEASIYLQAYNV